MLALLAAALAASASSPALDATRPWFERITVTLDGDGKQQSCKYQHSLSPKAPEPCEKDMAETIPSLSSGGERGLYSKLTFERRFSPGPKLDSGHLQTGDKLLGQQVMFLTIASDGSMQSCRVVGRSGEMLPAYGCKEARSEQFKVRAGATMQAPRQAFMTIMVYGHQEQIA